MTTLDEDLDYTVEPETPSIDNGGIAMALDRANWHLRKLGELHARRHETSTLFDAELDRITARRDEELAKHDRAIEWHARPLRELHAAILAEDPTRKSLVLPHGTLKSRTPKSPRLIIDNQPALVQFVYDLGGSAVDELLPRRDTVRVSDLSKIAQPVPTADGGYLVLVSGGELVPGVRAERGDTTYSIDLGEEI